MNMCDLFGIGIIGYLYEPKYHYRPNCVYDGYGIFEQYQWQFAVERYIEDTRKGIIGS